jgi:hypothetical protein
MRHHRGWGWRISWDKLREHGDDYEPLSRARLVAGALLPALWYLQAQRLRRCYQEKGHADFSSTWTCRLRQPRPALRQRVAPNA